MKIRAFAYLIAITGIMCVGCRDKNDIEEQRYTWTTDAPLSVPYRVRLQRFERENLVRNHSFETGRTFKLDSLNTSFAIDGWQLIGQNLQWTDISNDSLYTADEAYSGKRAVKIVRTRALETDEQGEGILSDFIKVIPGNYSLSLYVKMKDIYPLRARLGTKMFDGIDISVLFFDRNRNQMSGTTSFPQEDQEINTSYKALSFAHYRSVTDFAWGKITGKSHSFPFPEGDIPSDAHYARIFIGLKGTGTLWVDSVTFKFTDYNFSVAERMLKYTDTAYHSVTAVIPSPKMQIRMQSMVYYKNDMPLNQLPLILVDPGLDEEGLKAVEMIREAFQKKIAGFSNNSVTQIQVIRNTGQHIGESKLVFSIGKTDLYSKYLQILPVDEIRNRPQGYIIYTAAGLDNVVFVDANSSMGLHYAGLTLLQMFDKESPVFHNCRIVDYPDFPERTYTIGNHQLSSADIKKQVELALELTKYKINGAVLLHPENRELFYDQKIDHFRFIDVYGYLPPSDSSLTYEYPIIYSEIPGNSPDDLIPKVFHNQMLDNSNYEEINNSTGISAESLIYSGSSYFSLNTDAADIKRFTSVVGNYPVFMDNSMRITEPWSRFSKSRYFYPGKLRLYNLFEPFVNEDIREFFRDFDSTRFIINQPVYSEIEIIRLATAAEFMWNASDYNHDYALWKVLISRYGIENARDLIMYAEKYSILLEILLKLENNTQAARNLKSGQQVIAEITVLLGDISGRLGSQNDLVKELQMINAGLRSRINQKSGMVTNFKK